MSSFQREAGQFPAILALTVGEVTALNVP